MTTSIQQEKALIKQAIPTEVGWTKVSTKRKKQSYLTQQRQEVKPLKTDNQLEGKTPKIRFVEFKGMNKYSYNPLSDKKC